LENTSHKVFRAHSGAAHSLAISPELRILRTYTQQTKMSADALVSYAALILADAEVEISSDKLIAITKAAGSPVEQVSEGF
jgi:hypothetical protein